MYVCVCVCVYIYIFVCLFLRQSLDRTTMPGQFLHFLVDTGFFHVGQAGLELLTSDDPLASASQCVGIIGLSHHARQKFHIFKAIVNIFAVLFGIFSIFVFDNSFLQLDASLQLLISYKYFRQCSFVSICE